MERLVRAGKTSQKLVLRAKIVLLSDDGVSSLSDILVPGPIPERYFLTAKACKGILRRAEKRGKTLPALLQAALEAGAGIETTSTRPKT